LAGLAKVAAVDCDDEANKPLCGEMGVQGFPTLKIVRPGTKKGRPVVEDYQGARSTKAIVDAVVDKIPNHVKKLQSSNLDDWLADSTTPAKAILFTEKGTTSALIRSLAIDFLGSIGVGQIRSKEEAAVEKFGITQFPSIVLLPGQGQDPIVYTEDMKKDALVDFLSQVASPNPDPAPAKEKASKSKDSKAAKKSSSSFSKVSEAHKSSDFDDHMADSTIILDDDTPTESPLPIVDTEEKPMVVPEAAPQLEEKTAEDLDDACLAPKSGTCLLVLLPVTDTPDTDYPESAKGALGALAEIANKHAKRKDNTFPFYAVPAYTDRAITIRDGLGLKDNSQLEIIAINNKRGWWRHFESADYDVRGLEGFIDGIKLGEGIKSKLPEGFGATAPSPEAEAAPEPEAIIVDEPVASEAEPQPADAPLPDHDEL
jgi:protein disulfide-isomerase A6